MTKQETIIAPIEQVPFDDLYVSDLNPRTVFSPEGIEALAENIRQLGLIQNLAGLRDETGKVGIVAGGRRLRALALLQDDPRFATVSVKIAPDQATAEIWASSENHHREQPHAADEIREYGSMAERGVPVPSIAIAFGVNEKHVYRRLKLASLPVSVLDALKAGEITLSNAPPSPSARTRRTRWPCWKRCGARATAITRSSRCSNRTRCAARIGA
ncbi:ParB N-terminal domain-containing protein (plasmid) [Pseudosulfitobacter pseudonitzschiae]|uniref:ParB/RepB/Spo0J family partition protein n=1 Tax=Pseudosulfitobacter pseudonitzschiae TaxID=1402135 RepID=UPI001582B7B9|nr:ParB/Srx family N-terminal domain-containing protein [Pseudosulfitobacter pseudonitzschiae]QKS11572.1 ParB N-terminal domain-containing protein [Pseudosulfitobacter pseudonitzschiae]